MQRRTLSGEEPLHSIWQRRLLDECRLAERLGQNFVLLLFRLDSAMPRLAAETLDLIGDSLRGGVRQSDVVVRAGPALYAVLLVGSQPGFAFAVGERLVNHVRCDAGSLVRDLAERPLRFGVGLFDGRGSVQDAIAAAERDLRAGGASAIAPAA